MTGSNGMYIVYITYHHNIDVVKVIGCEVCKNFHCKKILTSASMEQVGVTYLLQQSKKASEIVKHHQSVENVLEKLDSWIVIQTYI